MLTREQLKRAVHVDGLTQTKQILLCLAAEPEQPRSVAEIRAIAVDVGLKAARKWNVSGALSRRGVPAIRVTEGWELTDEGRREVASISGAVAQAPPTSKLRTLLPQIENSEVAAFVEEAVRAAEIGHSRSAVVLSWVGAVALLYDHVLQNHSAAFNAEVVRRNSKWVKARSADDLARMKEYDFLQTLAAISVIGKNVKTELEGCLKLRNACGHPNSLKIGSHRVEAHIEILLLNVFAPLG